MTRWISVRDWLPEKDVRVLVYGTCGMKIAYRSTISEKAGVKTVDINVWIGEDGKYLFPSYWTLFPDYPREDEED